MSELQTSTPSVMRTTAERVRGRGRGGREWQGQCKLHLLEKDVNHYFSMNI